LVSLEEFYNEKLALVPQCTFGSCHPVQRKKNFSMQCFVGKESKTIAIVWIQYTVSEFNLGLAIGVSVLIKHIPMVEITSRIQPPTPY
jgi:hypothetical protein